MKPRRRELKWFERDQLRTVLDEDLEILNDRSDDKLRVRLSAHTLGAVTQDRSRPEALQAARR